MQRLLVAAVAVLVLAVGGALVARALRGGTIKPALSVVMPAGPDGGLRAPIDSTVQLQVTLAAPAYVYLFDEMNGLARLVWPHVGDAWVAGTYESESAVLEKSGVHHLVLVASPKLKDRWDGTTAAELLAECRDCESSAVTIEVFGERAPTPPEQRLNPN
ncbi:MAG: hypothetical protein IT380_19620 [Myxococcales bacterium]|nr:hypothetical protein [Myxococcales bacterium]